MADAEAPIMSFLGMPQAHMRPFRKARVNRLCLHATSVVSPD